MTIEESLFNRYKGKRVLLDSNLLLLLFIGGFSADLIGSCQRTSSYTERHLILLVKLLRRFSKVVTTPHVLTEVSNLAGSSLYGQTKLAWFSYFSREVPKLDELFAESKILARENEFAIFGITDTALKMMPEDTILMTEDRRLAGYLRSKELPALHFGDLFLISGYLDQ